MTTASVTLLPVPSISAVTDTGPWPTRLYTDQQWPEVCGRLDPGPAGARRNRPLESLIRRDSPTLTSPEVSKWPILGDLPLVGQFFRALETTSAK